MYGKAPWSSGGYANKQQHVVEVDWMFPKLDWTFPKVNWMFPRGAHFNGCFQAVVRELQLADRLLRRLQRVILGLLIFCHRSQRVLPLVCFWLEPLHVYNDIAVRVSFCFPYLSTRAKLLFNLLSLTQSKICWRWSADLVWFYFFAFVSLVSCRAGSPKAVIRISSYIALVGFQQFPDLFNAWAHRQGDSWHTEQDRQDSKTRWPYRWAAAARLSWPQRQWPLFLTQHVVSSEQDED
jgi:hypothetical protein